MDRDINLRAKWYAQPNDLIGGWCVMPVDKTPGEANIPEVADFTTEELAKHIAMLHNNWLRGIYGQGQ